jgi:hypothetical protein
MWTPSLVNLLQLHLDRARSSLFRVAGSTKELDSAIGAGSPPWAGEKDINTCEGTEGWNVFIVFHGK